MNNFLLKRNHFFKKPTFFLKKNYGFSYSLFEIYASKNNLSSRFLSRKGNLVLSRLLEKSAKNYNRLLKLEKKKHVEEIKKQSSWKGLRFRQGLPVNGQRTHTNSRVAKKLNKSFFIYQV